MKNTGMEFGAAASREHLVLTLGGVIMIALVVAAETLNHEHHDGANPLSPLNWTFGSWIYVAGYAACAVPFAVRRLRRTIGIIQRTLFGFALLLLVGTLLPAQVRPCFQTGVVLFAAMVVGRAGQRAGRLAMLTSAALLALNAAAIGQHELAEALLGIGLGWGVFQLSFSTQLDFLDETAPWRTVCHELSNLRSLWVANEREQWEHQYTAGYWEFLGSLRQRPRHYVIAGLIRDYFPKGASVLDVGCGLAVLYPLIDDVATSYVGIDLADTAIAKCRSNLGTDPRCSFQRVGFEEFTCAERFDVVVLNEVLYYFPLSSLEPVFRRALALLRDQQSILVISLCKNVKARLVGRKLRRIAAAEQLIRVHNGFTGSHWTVSVFRMAEASEKHASNEKDREEA